MQENFDLLTTAEVARHLGVQPNTVKAWRGRKQGPPYVRPANGRDVRYMLADVRGWLLSTGWSR